MCSQCLLSRWLIPHIINARKSNPQLLRGSVANGRKKTEWGGRKVISKEVQCGILPDDCCLPTSSNPTMSRMLTAPVTVSPGRLKENKNKRGHNPLA